MVKGSAEATVIHPLDFGISGAQTCACESRQHQRDEAADRGSKLVAHPMVLQERDRTTARRLALSHLLGEKKPSFGGVKEPSSMLGIAFRFRKFLFGLRLAFGRCKHRMTPVSTSRRNPRHKPQGQSDQ